MQAIHPLAHPIDSIRYSISYSFFLVPYSNLQLHFILQFFLVLYFRCNFFGRTGSMRQGDFQPVRTPSQVNFAIFVIHAIKPVHHHPACLTHPPCSGLFLLRQLDRYDCRPGSTGFPSRLVPSPPLDAPPRPIGHSPSGGELRGYATANSNNSGRTSWLLDGPSRAGDHGGSERALGGNWCRD